MIQLIAGEKGQGKTKRLIQMANDAAGTSDGHVVFIDNDNRHMYDLKHSIRFVETSSFPLSNYREFIGFVCGILSQDGDIKEIFVDGITKLIKTFSNEDLVKLLPKLKSLTESNGISFIISMNCVLSELPEEAKQYLIS